MVRKKIKDRNGFVAEGMLVHSGKYTYDSVAYSGLSKPVVITCPQHGNFKQLASAHLRGVGCRGCANAVKAAGGRLTNADYLKAVAVVHGDRYDLSKIAYSTTKDKIEVVCREHGSFFPRAGNFLHRASNCPKCKYEQHGLNSRLNIEVYLARFRSVHGDRFEYVRIYYAQGIAFVDMVCSTHGLLTMRVQDHLKGVGCRKCSLPVHDHETFLAAARHTHGNLYDYALAKYVKALDPVTIVCNKHGAFTQRPSDHINQGQGCPSCGGTGPSNGQREVFEFVRGLHPDAVMEHHLRSGGRVDIFLPSLSLGIEYHGLIWHSTRFHADPLNLLHKHKKADMDGIRIIHIFQDEWEQKPIVVRNMLSTTLGCGTRTYARQCEVRELSEWDAVTFAEANHLQGAAQGALSYGLFRKGGDDLLALMSFSGTTSDRTRVRGPGVWELRRFCSKGVVVGGASKLFNHFRRAHNPSEVVSYSDIRLFTGAMYGHLGFSIDAVSRPSYYYVTPGVTKRFNKSRFQLRFLRKMFGAGFDPSLTESDNCAKNGWYQLYDCGKVRWVWLQP